MTRWGLVSTIKAEATDVLNFAAYHLDAGAHRLNLYLDAPCPNAMPFLKAHPKILVILCDDAYWLKRRKSYPEKHQTRQTLNATRAYRRQCDDLDWLIHIDVDEFLWSTQPVADHLAQVGSSDLCARVRPIESLAGDGTAFKGYIPNSPERGATVGRIYPNFGTHVIGGFLSHLQGKLFVRTGLDRVSIRIHNAYQDGVECRSHSDLTQIDLCHLHGKDWHTWYSQYRYRLEKGSYRAELKPARPRETGGVTKHELLNAIEVEEGLSGLRAFYDELCADTPELRAKLPAEGLLKIRDLTLATKRRVHFPDFG
jgi:hypothetical protein